MTEVHLPSTMNDSDIAIIGMFCRLPGAEDIEAFWKNLRNGVESIPFFSNEELKLAGVDIATLNNPNYVKAGAFLPDIELFDAAFFDISPREAEVMEPQHRIFLESAWKVLEDAGYGAQIGNVSIGVYAGANMNTYILQNICSNPDIIGSTDPYPLMLGNDKDFLVSRVSYKLNLTGPSVNVQTACSTSLVAVHLACQSLLNGECDMALAGGVSIVLPQKVGYLYQESMIFSPDGHCRAFDAKAQGTLDGNGVGIVVLKRLEDAIADGDNIHAIIKGSAINNDGDLKVGYTAPSVEGQAAVISESQAVAGVEAETITYIEAHGTATPLGDPIEIAALTQVYRSQTQKKGFCAIGSVKTNVGHLGATAGITGLIKTVLALKHKMIPPSLHFEQPNPKIDFANSPFFVNAKLSEWKTEGMPRRAGISSFGIGGTNAHIILEESPFLQKFSDKSRDWQLLVLSAKTQSALNTATVNLIEHFKQHPKINFADVVYTLSLGRKVFEHRRILVCQTLEDATDTLSTLDAQRVFTHAQEYVSRQVVFMFSGQGSQYVNMGLGLYQNEAIFREQVDKCIDILKPHLKLDLREVLYPSAEQTIEAEKQLEQTAITQSTLFVIEYALAKLLMGWGIHPAAMIGHSIGEYVAACLAGVFSLEDALALVAVRGQLMQQMPNGAMLSVPLSEEKTKGYLNQELSLAACNAPHLCVISGTMAAINTLENQLAAQGIECRRLHISHAFHSAMMEPILALFLEQIKKVSLNPPQIPYFSNVSGTWIAIEEATDPNYWARHLRQTVRFTDCLQELLKKPEYALLEIGPGQTLMTLAQQHFKKFSEQVVLTSIRHPKNIQDDITFLLITLGKLWLAGVPINWAGFYANEQRHRLSLPTYPFERQRYWIDPPKQSDRTSAVLKTPEISIQHSKKSEIADWFYIPSWKRSVCQNADVLKTSEIYLWLLFIDECGLGEKLAQRLQQVGHKIITVSIGTTFTQLGENAFSLNPDNANDYTALFNELEVHQHRPKQFVHLWSVTANPDEASIEGMEKYQKMGFYSLLWLTQALVKQEMIDEIQLAVISNNIQAVNGEEVLCPEKATILGPIKVFEQEYPKINCCSIDIVFSLGVKTKLIEEQLLAELTIKSSDQVIAYRGKHRWVQTFEPSQFKPFNKTPKLREGGVYLITGGLGGIGLTLAEHLAKTVRPQLILTGRSAFPIREEWDEWLTNHEEHDSVSHKIRKIQILEAQGAKVWVVSVDVAHQQKMQDVITKAKQRFGSINGVIHAAGMPDGALISRQTREQTEMVLAPKVRGTLVLDSLLQDVKLDFFILCSSLASIFGIVGQVGYAAANAFLDAFAHYKAKRDHFTVAINWDAWQEVGMAVETVDHYWQVVGQTQKAAQIFVSKPQQEPRKISHPLFECCITESTVQERYISHLSVGKNWVLDDHRIMGKTVLPGTAYLELARAAFESHAKTTDCIEIREIYFLHPLIVEENEDKEVHLVLKKEGKHFEFVVSSKIGQDKWQEHTRGIIADQIVQPAKKYDIKTIERDCQQQEIILSDFLQKPQDEQTTTLETVLTEFGPHWHNLEWIKLGQHQGLAFLSLPNDLATDLTAYPLHPALLDMATGFLVLLQEQSEGGGLPFFYKRVTIKAPLPTKFYSYVRNNPSAQKGILKFDVTLIDEQGMELVEIEEFTLREAAYSQIASLAQSEKIAILSEHDNFSLEIATPGLLDTLTFIPASRQQPSPDEVEIEICATGLNFKEVLYAAGLLEIPDDLKIKFGLECAGRIVTVGKNVKDFQVGDEVIAFAPASFSAFTTTKASSVVPKPDSLSFEESATIPATFVTAYYALITKGQLSQGERVLIHAAAGGVGMAAVKIAKWVGAEIFATAGSPEKRAFLKSLEIQYVMDSRSTTFAGEIMEYTEGKGVDVLLNSLGGHEFIAKGLETLAIEGRFLELGIRDIYNNTQLGLLPFEKGLSYFAINADIGIPRFNALFREIVQHFNEGHFSPLPAKIFSITEVSSAFDYMAQARHIGKIVVSLQDKEAVIGQNMLGATEQWHGGELIDSSSKDRKDILKDNLQKELKEGLLPTEGIDVFSRIMGSTQPQVIVSTKDLQSRFEQNDISTMLSFVNSVESAHLSTAHARPQLNHAYVAPRDDVEQTLADIWQNLLGIDQIGIYDDFFELGGHSLMATQVVSRLKEAFGIVLTLSTFFEVSTIAEISKRVVAQQLEQVDRSEMEQILAEIEAL
ncbi:SDR family NAD(P)-dependent oxidoreductase [Candidatus Parabeggiatoa sp. HSG14]|uniref:SDR family NAD(P)-dependent oxidoreductase n=1 Tax=Candidatus Parabeggiatoa sp. HSG14 TaxID=3055593 RepID=UPI0025A6F468|nr:SDR family NAD(P)-dependent oxidoreductase [Thiotrichales bacterium HSG14]